MARCCASLQPNLTVHGRTCRSCLPTTPRSRLARTEASQYQINPFVSGEKGGRGEQDCVLAHLDRRVLQIEAKTALVELTAKTARNFWQARGARAMTARARCIEGPCCKPRSRTPHVGADRGHEGAPCDGWRCRCLFARETLILDQSQRR